jgi:NADH-quinone oxidoreductase subunit L
MAGPTPVSALIHAATMVTAGVVMLTRCSWLFVQAPPAMLFVAWIGVLTAFMGATIGLVQNDIKRVLAFSTVSQLGYMVLACGVGDFSAGMFHVTTHACFKALLFLGSGAVIHSMLGEQDMRKMGGLKQRIRNTWLVMAIGTYAIAGFPFLSGFWSKDAILDAALRSPVGFGMVFYLLGLVTALMTAFYMNRLMWKTFDTDPRFVDGELPDQHHSNFDEDHEHRGAGEHDADDAAGEHEHGATVGAAGSARTALGTAPDTAAASGTPAATPTYTDPHTTDHAHGGGFVHESPRSMMVPLYVLAFLSLVAGLALGPTHIFEKFLEPSIAPISLGGLAPAEEILKFPVGYIISAIVAIVGLGLAHMLYSQHRATGALQTEMAKQRSWIYHFFYEKWGFDHIYNLIFIGLGGWIADKLLWRVVDMRLIDGTVNGLAETVAGISSLVRRIQTGYVRNYALGMLFGVVALVAGVFYVWFSKLHQ